MRIGILAPLVTRIGEPQLGGSQAVVADVAASLTARGHDVEVLAAAGSEIPGVRVVDTGIDADELAADLFRAGSGPRPPSAALRAAFSRACALAASRGYEVVHNHGFDVPAISCALQIGCPVVHTLHLPPTEPMAEALRSVGRGPRPPAVACVSASHARAWAARVRVHAVLRNGVPVERIPWSPAADGPALFAGRLSPEKGAAEAVEIARRAGCPLVMYGKAYDEAYAAGIRATPGVRLEPGLPRRELWSRMAEACAVLCPARWDEPFGMVAAEAQAAGTPVIGFARGGLTEVVAGGVTGALVPDGDLDAAAEALSGVGRYDRTACRRHAERTLDLRSTVDAHENLYRRVVAGRLEESWG